MKVFIPVAALGALLAVYLYGCAGKEHMLIRGPNVELAGGGSGILVGTKLDGAYLQVVPFTDLRDAEPADFGRSEDVLLTLSGDSVSSTLLKITKKYFRNIGFLVGKPPASSKCSFELRASIERFWVLAEPINEEGVADEYTYFITIRASLKDKNGKYVFKNRKFELTRKVSRYDIDPFAGDPPTSSYLLNMHKKAISQIFDQHYIDLLSQVWDAIRTKASCPNAIDDATPPPYLP